MLKDSILITSCLISRNLQEKIFQKNLSNDEKYYWKYVYNERSGGHLRATMLDEEPHLKLLVYYERYHFGIGTSSIITVQKTITVEN